MHACMYVLVYVAVVVLCGRSGGLAVYFLRFHNLQRHHLLPQRGHFLFLLLLFFVKKLDVIDGYKTKNKMRESGIPRVRTIKGARSLRSVGINRIYVQKSGQTAYFVSEKAI